MRLLICFLCKKDLKNIKGIFESLTPAHPSVFKEIEDILSSIESAQDGFEDILQERDVRFYAYFKHD